MTQSDYLNFRKDLKWMNLGKSSNVLSGKEYISLKSFVAMNMIPTNKNMLIVNNNENRNPMINPDGKTLNGNGYSQRTIFDICVNDLILSRCGFSCSPSEMPIEKATGTRTGTITNLAVRPLVITNNQLINGTINKYNPSPITIYDDQTSNILTGINGILYEWNIIQTMTQTNPHFIVPDPSSALAGKIFNLVRAGDPNPLNLITPNNINSGGFVVSNISTTSFQLGNNWIKCGFVCLQNFDDLDVSTGTAKYVWNNILYQ
jgi:hypothetical protein